MAISGLLTSLKRLFAGAAALSPEQEEEFRRLHLERCHNFKLLLAANNRALEVMSDMEEALAGGRVFGAGYVREACTRVASEVFQIVRGLTGLAPGRYDGLFPRFRSIQAEINEVVLAVASRREGPLVMPLADLRAAHLDEAGSKLANLGELARALGAEIPRGFAVTASGFARFMAHDDLQAEVDRRIQAADASRLDEVYALSSSLQGLIAGASLPPDLEAAIRDEARRLADTAGDGLLLAVRSSAVGEDALGASFAGQYHTELGVDPDEAVQAYREVVAAKYGVTAMTYRLVRGIPDQDVPMCVGIMEMVDATASGVAYSRDPLRPVEGGVLIEAVPGLPKAVVDGSAAVDRFFATREEPLALAGQEVARKEFRYGFSAGAGLDRIPLDPEEAGRPCLDEARVLAVARLALAAERHFGGPQDLEWAFAPDGRLVLLQCRPLKDAAAPASPAPSDIPADGGGSLLAGGMTASPGAAAGEAFAARKDADALRFPPGGVLVVAQALPFWATLLSRAAAVVAERGSAAGHLANVAREYGVPALFGVSGAMAALDGVGTVTVDADGRRVLPGDATAALPRRERPASLMLGSPVHSLLSRAAQHIVPLTLLDPSAPEFAPEGCATLHDITRFCHEKSVEEMFSHGADLPLPTQTARRLSVAGRAMQYWIIDLGDGVSGPVEGKTVPLEQIASAPMLALWRGMTAAPWAGPPVDARGFMSVLAGSASNPDLDPASASAFAEKNYFMISSDFCSLQSRFGYHFSTVEALIGDDDAGNYLSFRFKGGAADHSRRARRASMIAEVLEALGFRCETKADALFARMEGYGRQFMEERLAALGHVIVHTRQMDMAMADAGQAEALRRRLLADISGRLVSLPGP
ncbi:MAG: PEP/pyruvate-binding domain-containing protein [Thermodesulfobacteriota bacterium]